MHRLEDKLRVVSFLVEVHFNVGYHDCAICEKECPPPTDEQLVVLAREWHTSACSSSYDPHRMVGRIVSGELPAGGCLWPKSVSEPMGYMPAGWAQREPEGLICPECNAAIQAAIDTRKPHCPYGMSGPDAAENCRRERVDNEEAGMPNPPACPVHKKAKSW